MKQVGKWNYFDHIQAIYMANRSGRVGFAYGDIEAPSGIIHLQQVCEFHDFSGQELSPYLSRSKQTKTVTNRGPAKKSLSRMEVKGVQDIEASASADIAIASGFVRDGYIEAGELKETVQEWIDWQRGQEEDLDVSVVGALVLLILAPKGYELPPWEAQKHKKRQHANPNWKRIDPSQSIRNDPAYRP